MLFPDDIEAKNIIYMIASIIFLVCIVKIAGSKVNIIEEFIAGFNIDNSIEDFNNSSDKYEFYLQSVLALMEFSLASNVISNIICDDGIWNKLAGFFGDFFLQLALCILCVSTDIETLTVFSMFTPIAILNPFMWFMGFIIFVMALAVFLSMLGLDVNSALGTIIESIWNAAITQITIRTVLLEVIKILIFAAIFRGIIIPKIDWLPIQLSIAIGTVLSIIITKIEEFFAELIGMFDMYEDGHNWFCGITVIIVVGYSMMHI